jgi:uncharacterized membrane protein
MKNFSIATISTASVLNSGAALAQSGNMMNGGMWGSGWMGGGYGGYWPLILICFAVIGLVVWIISRKGK